jgi:hypothetical protein
LALLGGAAWIGLAARPSVPAAALVLALCAVWLVPAARLRSLSAARVRLCAPLPLPASARAGGSQGAFAVVALPVLVAVAGVAVAWGGAA